jgi:hypothetical protein
MGKIHSFQSPAKKPNPDQHQTQASFSCLQKYRFIRLKRTLFHEGHVFSV